MAKSVKIKDDNNYECYFNISYHDFENIFLSADHPQWDITIDVKYNIYDPRIFIQDNATEILKTYDILAEEKQAIIHQNIASYLSGYIAGAFNFLDYHYDKFETERRYVIYDPNEVTSPGYMEFYQKHHLDSKILIIDPDFYKHEKFMEFYREHGSPKIINKKPFLIFIKEMLPYYPEISDSRKHTILEWVNEKLADLKNSMKPVPTNDKIRWKGTPSQFGFLINRLVCHGFIDPPIYNGETNFTGLARLCYDHFEIETTLGNLTKEVNPEKNTLSDTKRAKFTIPDLIDLA
jgi:hypothetical protein